MAPTRGVGGIIGQFIPRQVGKRTVGIGLLWIFGLFAVFLAPAPVKMTDEKMKSFQLLLNEAHAVDAQLSQAEREYMDADLESSKYKVWFWRWREEYRKKVMEHQPMVDAAKKQVDEVKKERNRVLRAAKQSLGLWSDLGVQESRTLLWNSFESGKLFAQRQTFWDSIFTLLNSRRDDWFVLLLQLLFTALINYTVGAFFSVFTFILSLPSFVSSFSPGFLSALAFIIIATVGAVSLIATYLGLIYASGAAVVYTTASFVSYQRRLAYQQQQQRLRMHVD